MATTYSKGRATSSFQAIGHSTGGNVIGVAAEYSLTATGTANSIFRLIKVPDQARLLEGISMAYSTLSYTIQVGDDDSATTYGTHSVSTTLTNYRFKLPIGGKKYSCTANATARYKYLQVKTTAVGASKGSARFALTAFYVMAHKSSKTNES